MVYSMKYNSAIKSNKVLICVTIWIKPKNVMLSKISLIQRPHIIGFYSHERSKTGTSTEIGSTSVVF